MRLLVLFVALGAAHGIHLSCDFYFDYSEYGVLASTYYCLVTAMDFSDNPTHITAVSGEHLSGFTSADVRKIYFYCDPYNFTALPKGLLDFFPNLQGFIIFGCPLNLVGNELEEYPGTILWAHGYTSLERIPGNFFAPTPKMQHVEIFRTQLKHVGVGLLDHLYDLSDAIFLQNTCIDQEVRGQGDMSELIHALREQCPDL